MNKFMRMAAKCLILVWTANTFGQEYNPTASSNAVVLAGKARFTVLTPKLIRMEWSETGKFEDQASLTFINRNLPVPSFKTKEKRGVLSIVTDFLELKYDASQGKFSTNNLSVTFKKAPGKTVEWHPGMANSGNLLGTARTLDQCDGGIQYPERKKLELDQGIISRDGWTLVDDSGTPLFDRSDWQWVIPRAHEELDWYFFGYGLDYKGALKDFTQAAGKIPVLPKFAFGIWWSKYWPYTDLEYREIVKEYKEHKLPLDVLVFDMDWHIVFRPEFFNKDGKRIQKGWTGFTWEKAYFPDPEKFLKWTDDENLQTCMNLHPAEGIASYESMYPEFSKAMGIDPASKKTVPFNIVDKKYATTYFDLVVHPMEKQGIDFWWLDWQQWNTTEIPGVNPTFYLNYVHFSDMQRQGKRPMTFHRYGGLGNHRYPIGLSGDVLCSWTSLAYQPYFTATAANVGFGYWSHDIGGHMNGDPGNAELFTRWVQLGVFSPILRTHSTTLPEYERRVWAYPYDNFKIMRDAMQLRFKLFPYIYSAAREAHETGVSLIRPMYYEFPGEESAYQHPEQYMFGDDLLIAPVTHPIAEASLYATQKVWLPEGRWIELGSGAMLKGGQLVERPYLLSEMPVFVREGAVIPMQSLPDSGLAQVGRSVLRDITLAIFPGAVGGKAVIYDDEGNNENYLKGAFTKTKVVSRHDKNRQVIKILPVEGRFPGMAEKRQYTVELKLTYPPKSITVNNQPVSWEYNGEELTTIFKTGNVDVYQPVNIEILFPEEDAGKLSGRPGLFKRLMFINQYINNHDLDWGYSKMALSCKMFPQDFAAIAQTGLRITYQPDVGTINRELKTMDESLLAMMTALELFAEGKPQHLRLVNLLRVSAQNETISTGQTEQR